MEAENMMKKEICKDGLIFFLIAERENCLNL